SRPLPAVYLRCRRRWGRGRLLPAGCGGISRSRGGARRGGCRGCRGRGGRTGSRRCRGGGCRAGSGGRRAARRRRGGTTGRCGTAAAGVQAQPLTGIDGIGFTQAVVRGQSLPVPAIAEGDGIQGVTPLYHMVTTGYLLGAIAAPA